MNWWGKEKFPKMREKKIVDDFFENTETKKEEFERKLKEAAENLMDKISLPTKTEFDELKQKVADLEAKLAEKESKPAAKKTTTRKSATAKKTTRKSTKKE